MITALFDLLFVALAVGIYQAGRWAGRQDEKRNQRSRTPATDNVRDMLSAYEAAGVEKEQAQAAVREAQSMGMRKLGAWKAE